MLNLDMERIQIETKWCNTMNSIIPICVSIFH